MSVPARIALVLDSLSALTLGGEHAVGLARAFSSRGHDVAIFGASFAPVPHALDAAAADSPAQNGAASAPTAGDDAGVRDRRRRDRDTPRGRRALLEFRPQALIAYDAMSPSALQSARIARHLRTPLVLVEHGSGGAAARTLLRGLSRVGSSLWGPYVRRAATSVVALDPWSLNQARREGFPLERVRVIPHGVDVERFRPGLSCPLTSRHRIQGRVVLSMGPLEAASRHELAIDAFARTVGQRSDWCLMLAGDGSQRTRLRAVADRAGVGAKVHMVGEVSQAELPGVLSGATLALLAGTHPRAELFAQLLASGVPIVAEAGGRAEFLVGEHCGVSVHGGAWAEGLGSAAGAPEQRRRWAQQARRVAESELDWRVVAKAFEGAIGDLRERLAG